MRVFPEEFTHHFLNLRHACRAAHQDHLVDVSRVHLGVLERLLHRRDRLLNEIVHQLLQLGSGQPDVEVLGTRLIRRDERQIDIGLHGAGELAFSLLGGFLQTLQRHGVLR